MADDANGCFKDSPVATAQQSSCPKDPPPPKSKVFSGYFAIKTETKPPKGKKSPVQVSFEKINSAILGSKVYIIIETSDLKTGKVTVEILGSESEVIIPMDDTLPVMVGNAETKTLSADVGNWASKTEYTNAASLVDKAIIEIDIKPSSTDTLKQWRTKIGQHTPKKAFFHLKVTAQGGNDTEYTCEDDKLTSPSKEKSIFLNKKDARLQLCGCYCDKPFEVWEIKEIYPKGSLFAAANCPLPVAQRTFQKFTDELNKAMKAYSITSCLQKAHFLSQAEGETNLDTTLEYASGADYDISTHQDGYDKYKKYHDHRKDKQNPFASFNTPHLKHEYDRYNQCISMGNTAVGDGPKYKGRGIIQITWKSNYATYFGAIGRANDINSPEFVGSDLHYVCDSAAWYWTNGSNLGNLNSSADEDDFIYITVGINGGMNGFVARKTSVQRIIRWMNLNDICINKQVTNKVIGSYKYSTSAIRNTDWGRKHKSNIESHDD